MASPTLFPSYYRKELLELKGDKGGREIKEKYSDFSKKIELKNSYQIADIDTISAYNSMVNKKN